MEHIAINGLDVAVEVVGTGPPLVLLHGILQDSRAWRPQLEQLRDEFTVVAWDAPGCGRSVDPPETWRFPEYADCLADLLAALRLTTLIIGGLSWGGTLAIEFEHQHPGVASALILAGAYAGWAGSLPSEMRDERLASCLAQSKMAPEDFVPDWMPGLFTPAAPSELVDEYMGLMSDFHPSGFLASSGAPPNCRTVPAIWEGVRRAARQVFRAHTDPELVVQWLGPRRTEMRIDHWECRTGGSYRYLHISDGNEFGFHGCFHEVRPSELIVQTFTFGGEPDGVALERLVLSTSATAAPGSRRPHWSTPSRAATPSSRAAWRTASARATSASMRCWPADLRRCELSQASRADMLPTRERKLGDPSVVVS